MAVAISRAELLVFTLFHVVGGQLGMLLILAAVLSQRCQRHSTFVNFCLTWILYSFSWLLLVYTGHIYDEDPPMRICAVQASMNNGSTALIGTSSLMLILDLFITLRRSLSAVVPHRWSMFATVIMLALPYVAFMLFCVTPLAIILHDSNSVRRNSFTCSIVPGARAYGVTKGAVIYAVICGVITIAMEGWMAFMLLQQRRKGNGLHKINAASGFTIARFARMSIFTILAFTGLGLCLTFFNDGHSQYAEFYLMISFLPLSAFLLFGTQKDILAVWCCKRPPQQELNNPSRFCEESAMEPEAWDTMRANDSTIQFSSFYSSKQFPS